MSVNTEKEVGGLDSFVLQETTLGSSYVSDSFLVPNFRIGNRSQSASSLLPYAQFLEPHYEYRSSAEPWLATFRDRLTKRCLGELSAVELTFPYLSHRSDVLCMAAWLSLLCALDDVVEQMSPDAAGRSLHEADDLLERELSGPLVDFSRSCRPSQMISSAKSYMRNLLTSCIQRKQTVGRKVYASSDSSQTLHSEVSLSFSTASTSCPPLVSSEAKVKHMLSAFVSYIRSLLPASHAKALCREIQDVIRAMQCEVEYRGTRIPNVDLYMRIRFRTVGLSPLFGLLQRQSPNKKLLYSKLERLTTLIKTIVGLQNDLVGLERDLESDEAMNYVVVATEGRILAQPKHQRLVYAQPFVKRAVLAHNLAVEEAIIEWRHIQSQSGSGLEKTIASTVLAFTERHLLWAASNKRYQVHKTKEVAIVSE